MKFSIKDFFCKCDQIPSFLRIWSHLLNKSLIENSVFCAVLQVLEQEIIGIIAICYLFIMLKSLHCFSLPAKISLD